MNEYMFLIRNRIGHQSSWTPERHKEFLKSCEVYINDLKNRGRLISAQPLVREGVIISGTKGDLMDAPYNESDEIQVGYYHILADSMEEALKIARQNPEFEFSSTARIEVRPIKTKEKDTGFVYPKTT